MTEKFRLYALGTLRSRIVSAGEALQGAQAQSQDLELYEATGRIKAIFRDLESLLKDVDATANHLLK